VLHIWSYCCSLLERPSRSANPHANHQRRFLQRNREPRHPPDHAAQRYQADFIDGADKLTKDTLELDQAVLPFRLNDDWSLITRTKLPAEALPPKNAGNHWVDGLDNGYTTFFLSPEHGRGFYWGAGPVLYYPATNSTLGTTKWGSGPSVAFVHEDAGPWVYALVANNIWSFSGGPGSNTEPIRCCSIRSSAIISGMAGR